MNIAVTGSSGYVGSALSARLTDSGHEVVKCDIGWFGERSLGPYAQIDLMEVETIIHLAGHSSVLMAENDPIGAWSNNVTGFKHLLDSLRPHQRLIYASSGSVYGNSGKPAQESDAGLNVLKTYDMTKVVGDVLASNAINQGKRIVGLRFGTVNGLSPNTRVDLMLNAMSYAAITKGAIDVKNPKIFRPILFLEDLLHGVDSVLKQNSTGVFNLSSQNVSVDQVARFIVKETGCKINYQEDDVSPYDFHLDCTLFESTFGKHAGATMKQTVNDLLRNINSVNVGKRENAGNEILPGL